MTKARNLTTLAAVTSTSGNTVYINGNVSFANASLSLGANSVNSASLTTTGVVANSYGNTTAIPVITVDAAGRITNATTSSVSGVTGLSFAPANSTITVSTSTTNFDAAVTSGNSTVQGLLKVVDSVSNTSSSIASSANSVTTAYLLAANAVSNATAYAASAYSNATSYTDTAAGTAYSNAVSVAASDATTKAGTAYSNAVSVAASDATTKAGTAYSNATSYADTKASTAYSNAVSVAASDATTKAGTAYSNATSYADTKAGTAYSNATSYADTKAATAYSNATSYADTKAANAYSNVFNGGTFSGAVTVQANLTANNVRMNGDLQIDGNLTVLGNTVSIYVSTLNVEDNMIYLNSNSTVSHPDLGFAGNYNDGSYKHAGLFRDATDGVWKFFHGYTPEPDASAFIDTSNASFTFSNLQINYVIGNVTGSANSATYLGGNTATTLRSYSDTMAGTAYSNATTYADTKAATAYSNAVSVAASDATTKAGTAYSNATTYAATIAGTAYSNATSYAATIAGTAYSNAVSVAASDATTKAGTAYSNATSYAATIAGTAYSNAVSVAASDATTKAGTAYSNAVAYAASNSYVNSTFLKLAGGTLTGAVTFDGGATSSAGPIITSSATSGPRLSIKSTDTGGKDIWLISNGTGNADGAGKLQLWNSTDSYTGATFATTSSMLHRLYGSYTQMSGSARAPLFYDSDDTGYYLDPNASLSANFAGHVWIGSTSFANPGGWNKTLTLDGTNHARIRLKASAYGSYGANETYMWLDNTVTPNSGIVAPNIFYLNASYTQMANSARAPLFYDLDDTGYYIDPNSTSNTALRMRGGALFGPNINWGAYLYIGTNGSIDVDTATIAATNGNLHLDARNGYVMYLNNYATSSYTVANQSIRSPIFYDFNDTGYYVDPNGTSELSGFSNGTKARAGLSIHHNNRQSNTGDTNYWVGSQGWGATYTWNSAFNALGSCFLDQWGTGMTGHPQNNGSNYIHAQGLQVLHYRDGGSVSYGWQMVGAGDAANRWWLRGKWGSTYRSWYEIVLYDINVGGSLYPSIVYDSNDTGYYVDPNGSSQLQGHTRFGPYAGSTSSGNQSGVEIRNNGGTGDGDVACISWHCANYWGLQMHLRHDGYFGIGGWSASTWRWYSNTSNGDMTAAGNVTAYSDPRLKEDVKVIESAIDKVKQLNGVKFKWIESSVIGHPGEYDYGILSTDVEKIAPELVVNSIHEAPEGDFYKTVAYDKLVAFTIEAIKEQQVIIESQEARIAKLEALINKLVS